MRRGVTLLSGIIFLALTISATVIVYEAGVPVIKRVQSAALVEQMKDTFSELDRLIRQVASEGQGSKRTVYLTLDQGKLVVNSTEDVVYWEFDTDAFIISPRTDQRFGNIRVGSNLDTKTWEGTYQGTDCYIMENEHLIVYARKIGTPTSYAAYDTSQILLAIYHKDLDKWLNNTGFLEVNVDGSTASRSGNGYTDLVETGKHLPYGTVTAFMNSSYTRYRINFTLQSGTDFLEIKGSI